ncbi:MAG TPA: hypothetical protein VGM05_08265 [Planctomycetaceae bacterium]|jgi:hypothetical protein
MLGDFLAQSPFPMSPDAKQSLVFVIPLITLAIVVPLLVRMWYSMKIKQWEMSLKHTMLERGMSVEEIKAVLEATSSKHSRNVPFPMAAACGSKRDEAC